MLNPNTADTFLWVQAAKGMDKLGNKERVRWRALPTWLLTFYVSLSPIYWLPFIPYEYFSRIKIILFTLGILSVVLPVINSKRFYLPKGYFGLIGLLSILISAIPGLIQCQPGYFLGTVMDYCVPFIFLWVFYLYTKLGGDFEIIFWRAALFIILLASIVAISGITHVPAWRSPASLGGVQKELWVTGFHGASTGWSEGISYFFPIIVGYLMNSKKRLSVPQWSLAFGFSFVAILSSQYVTGGRTGMLCTLFVIFFYLFWNRRKLFFLALILFSFISINYYSSYKEHLRFVRLQERGGSINQFSSGRIEGYRLAWQLFKERPFVGHGFGKVDLDIHGLKYPTIHNVWLRMAVESGIFHAIAVLTLFGSLIFYYLKRFPIKVYRFNYYLLVLALGLFISMFEPYTLFGSFQNFAIVWAVFGALLGISEKDQKKRILITAGKKINHQLNSINRVKLLE